MKRYVKLVVLSALPIFAADDFSGSWKIEGDIAGNAVNRVCKIKQEGVHLSGSCTGDDKSYDLTGDVDGKKITFKHGGEYNGGALTISYAGTLGSDGAIKGAMDVEPYGATGDFKATKN